MRSQTRSGAPLTALAPGAYPSIYLAAPREVMGSDSGLSIVLILLG
jgi:hypothetical protein